MENFFFDLTLLYLVKFKPIFYLYLLFIPIWFLEMADAPPQKKSKLSDEKVDKKDFVESFKEQRSKVSTLQKLCLF